MLIVVYMVISILVILATSFATRSISEKRVATKEKDSIQAFWIAEAGLDMAISNLAATSLSGTLGSGNYSTQTTSISSTQYLITSTGGVPGLDTTDPNNIVRSITAIVEQPTISGDPSGVTSAIAANGDIDVIGSSEVNGEIDENATFDFEDIFGLSKEFMENNASNIYTDPGNNVTPVVNSTWINASSEITISDSNWEGSGLLVVNGDLKITGGNFEGVLWVIGSLSISGNPIISGAIFAESGAEYDTTVTGNATVSFDSDDVSDAFGNLPSGPPQLISWKEN